MIRSTKGRETAAAFGSRHLRLTAQRYAVLDYVSRHPVHATAEQIFRGVNRRDPRASRATIYNSLHALVRAGLVREVRVEGRSARFDANLEPHHHFVCERCGALEDIARGAAEDLPPVALEGRSVRSYEILFRGCCAACAAKEESPNA